VIALASTAEPTVDDPSGDPVPDPDHRSGLFPALLKHWRGQRGLSQLDLALTADVSSRHVSFLETGRSRPSAAMVLRLAAALGIPLRQVNAMLRAAGHEPVYDEAADALPPEVVRALSLLKEHHEPFPLVVVDRTYRVLDLNRGAVAVLGAVLGSGNDPDDPDDPDHHDQPDEPVDPQTVVALGLNLARLTFDPHGAQPHLANFDEVGPQLLWRIQREVLADPDDGEMRDLLDELLEMPSVDDDWRHADLSVPSAPALVLHLRRDGLDLRFLTTITSFQAPQNVAVEHLRIETWFPFDDATTDMCRRLAEPGRGRSAR
jgi:transcriptional regulator with XRE-family HTH domain